MLVSANRVASAEPLGTKLPRPGFQPAPMLVMAFTWICPRFLLSAMFVTPRAKVDADGHEMGPLGVGVGVLELDVLLDTELEVTTGLLVVDGVDDIIEDDVGDGAEDGAEAGAEDKSEAGVEARVEDEVEDGAEDGVEDGVRDRVEGGVEDDAKDGVEYGVEDDSEDKVEDSVEEGAEDCSEEGVEDGIRDGAKDGVSALELSVLLEEELELELVEIVVAEDENEEDAIDPVRRPVHTYAAATFELSSFFK